MRTHVKARKSEPRIRLWRVHRDVNAAPGYRPRLSGSTGMLILLVAATLTLGVKVCRAEVPVEDSLLVGAARVEITPREPVILAGYGHRTEASEGVDQLLFARAIAIGSPNPMVAVTIDNCGVPGELAERIKADLVAAQVTPRDRVVILSTHTHNAPALPGYAPVLWAERSTAAQDEAAQRYADFLVGQVRRVVQQAVERQQPATMQWSQGEVSFGGNRRVMIDGVWSGFGLQPEAPVDHALPVLVARDSSGAPVAIWTTYACHCTTLGGVNRVAGDWAGCAALAIESAHPDCVALISIGCGADVGPQPGGSAQLAEQHGREIADEVARLLPLGGRPLTVVPSASSHGVELAFDQVPEREFWEREVARGGFEATRARRMLARLDAGETLPAALDYELVAWRFGDELAMVFLPGEVTVDYAVRLKSECDWERLWIHGWANDVPCYIPSRRVLLEGGYESDFSMVYYDRPSRFSLEVETTIVDGVRALLGAEWEAREAPPASQFRFELSPTQWRRRLESLAPELTEAPAWPAFAECVASRPYHAAWARWTQQPKRSSWYDLLGSTRDRAFLRQTDRNQSLSWETPEIPATDSSVVLAFTGGLGWRGQPKTEGFELRVWTPQAVEPRTLRLDVDAEVTQWSSESNDSRLIYLPIWRSDEDTAGVFLLQVAAKDVPPGAWRIEVRSLGEGSQRWMAVDDTVDGAEVVARLLAITSAD